TPAPAIVSFTASPTGITQGQSSTLSWNVTGAQSVTIDSGIGAVSAASSKTVSPAQTTTYTLTATNSGGNATARVTVTVVPASDQQPPSPPSLMSAVAKGSNQVDLAWSASSDNVGVAGYQVLRNGGALTTVPAASL